MADMLPRSTALVVAHPDDEVLWFSSVLASMDAILFCYEAVPSRPDWTAGRRRAVLDYPLRGAQSLGLTESEVFNGADWASPRKAEYGLEVKRHTNALPGINVSRYLDNYAALRAALRTRLAGFAQVYTHNPWGEYGHEEHVQVYRAVKSLQPELGFTLWFGNYCSNKSSRLMLQYVGGFDAAYETRETDPRLGETLAELYKQHDCWTWYDTYRWFTHECFMADQSLPQQAPDGHIFPLNYIKVAEAPVAVPRAYRAAATMRNALSGFRRAMRQPG